MSKIIVKDNILLYKLKEVTIKINLNLISEKIRNPLTYKNKYFVGGNNIVLIVEIDKKEYALRISIKPKDNIPKFVNEIDMMYHLKKLGVGVDIYYPEEYRKIVGITVPDNNKGNHTFSIIEYCENGSVYDYINDDTKKLDDKKSKIDKVFEIIEKLIENNIYCYDIKFRNFVIDSIGNVKIIDISDCYKNDFSIDPDYKLIYETVVYIQLFSECQKKLIKHFISKLESDKIYTTYLKLYYNDKIYSDTNYMNLLYNLFWYYRKTEINYDNITEIMNEIKDITDLHKIFQMKIIEKKDCKLIMEPKFVPFAKYFLFVIFEKIVRHFNDDDNRNFFYTNYKYKIEEKKNIKEDIESSDEKKCVILDGKKRRSKKTKRLSKKRKSKRRSKKKSKRRSKRRY